MSRTKLSFVFQEALGWKVYRSRVLAVAGRREDIEVQFISVPPITGWRKPLLKRNNVQPRERIVRWLDPITAYRGKPGAEIRRQIREFQPAAIYLGGHWLAAALTGLSPRVPYAVATDHTRAGMERSLPRRAWSRADMDREAMLLRQADHVYPMSEWTAESLRKDCGVDPARITVMAPSLDLSNFVPSRYEDHGVLRIIFIGNDFLRKGGDRLCKWVAGPLAGKAELHVVSSDPDVPKDSPGVISHGRVPNDRLLREFLPGMDVLCLPTKSDMSSLVIVEGAAAGIPVVASAIGGLPEMIVDGETGYLVPAEDEAGFLAALERLAADPSLRRRMGERAWTHARVKFDATLNYNALIDQLIALGRTA